MKKMDPVVHFEMPYENRERLMKFYSHAFGWQLHALGQVMGDYVTAATAPTDENRMLRDPGAINGGFFPKKPEWPSQPSVVIQVEDLQVSMKLVEEQGGSIQGEPMEIPGIGRYVAFKDSEGNRVGMLQPKI